MSYLLFSNEAQAKTSLQLPSVALCDTDTHDVCIQHGQAGMNNGHWTCVSFTMALLKAGSV